MRRRITTLPSNLGTARRDYGSLTATRSRNGKHLNQVVFCGSMGSVSLLPSSYSFTDADGHPFRSGVREECALVRYSYRYSDLENLRYRPVPPSSRTLTQCGNLGLHRSPCFIVILGRNKRGAFVACSHLC